MAIATSDSLASLSREDLETYARRLKEANRQLIDAVAHMERERDALQTELNELKGQTK